MRYSQSKTEATIGYLWEVQPKTAKKDYFTKKISSLTFFEINTSNFQEIFLAIFRKFCGKESKQKVKKKLFFGHDFFKFYFLNFILTEFSKYCKIHFLKVRGSYLKKIGRDIFLVIYSYLPL